MSAKASAGPSAVNLRDKTCFSQNDLNQLLHHELMTHTLSLQNGRKQKWKILGLNSPRTTFEGKPCFSYLLIIRYDVSVAAAYVEVDDDLDVAHN